MKRFLILALLLAGPAAAQLQPEPSPPSLPGPIDCKVVPSSLYCKLEQLDQLRPRSRPEPATLSPAPPPRRFDLGLDELVRQGILTTGERDRIRNGGPIDTGAFQRACQSGALSPEECRGGVAIRWGRRPGYAPITKPLSPREQALLQRIRQGDYTPQWRTYGQCNYDWSGWRLHANGTRTTAADCGGTAQRWQIGVSCDRLVVSVRSRDGSWGQWEQPSGPESKFRQGEDEMVAALCANAEP